MREVFKENLELLEKQHPLLAFQLRCMEFEQVIQREEESEAFLPREETEVIYVYGLGLGYCQFERWLHLKKGRFLVFIEDDLKAFQLFLTRIESKSLLLDSQVELIPLIDSPKAALKEVIYSHLFCPYECVIMPGKEKGFQDLFRDLSMKIEMDVCLYRDYGISSVKNILHNLRLQREIILGDQLKGAFGGIPAILCGAGPSLEKKIEQLKSCGDRALIFAGGSALAPLSENGVPIHFGASLDPAPPRQRFLRQSYFEIPFFYQNQLDSKLFSQIQGKRVCFGESGAFPLERWIMKTLDACPSHFDAGTHVGTFLIAVAQFLGCSPIVLVGMDGCLSGETLYSKGVQRGEEAEKRKNPLVTRDRLGQSTHTRVDFLLGRSWIEGFAKAHRHTEFFNVAERGLQMEGVSQITLKDLLENHLLNRFDLWGMVHHTLESIEPVSFDLELIESIIGRVSQSLSKCLVICKEILRVLGKEGEISIDDKRSYFLRDHELSEEIFFQMVLLPLWNVWRQLLQKREVISKMRMPEIEKKIQQLIFFRDVCERYQNG